MDNKRILQIFTNYITKRSGLSYIRKRGCVNSFIVIGKTIDEVYADFFKSLDTSEMYFNEVWKYMEEIIVNIIDTNSPNHSKCIIYDYGSTQCCRDFDSLPAISVTILKNVIKIYTRVPENPSDNIVDYIAAYHR